MPTVHPLSLGVWWGAARSHPAALEIVGEADLVLGIGVRAGTEVGVGLLNGEGQRRAARRDGRREARRTGPALGSVGQLAAAVEKLAASCRARETAQATLDACARARELQQRGLDVELDAVQGHAAVAHRGGDRRAGPADDPGHLRGQRRQQRQALDAAPGADLGAGVALPVGLVGGDGLLPAGRARGGPPAPNKKVVGLCGDTSFLMASSDFLTICEQKLPVVIAIHHDQRIGMIDNMHTKAYGRAYASEIGRVDFVKYAEAFGATGHPGGRPGRPRRRPGTRRWRPMARSSWSCGPATTSRGRGRSRGWSSRREEA